MRFQPQVFICHVGKDEPNAEHLYHMLLQEGFRPWIDKLSIPAGKSSDTSIQEALAESDFFLVCLSENSVDQKGKLDKEMQKALSLLWKGTQHHAFVIPVRLHPCRLPASLVPFESVDLFSDSGWANLVRAIRGVMESRAQLYESFAHLPQPTRSSERLTPKAGGEPAVEGTEDILLEGPEDTSSSYEWEVELRRIVNGSREYALRRVEGVEEYIEVALAESEDLSVAETAFHKALRNVVQTWQPSYLETEDQVAHMLELIGRYTPEDGFVKVMTLLQEMGDFDKKLFATADIETAESDLYLKALRVLENCYEAPPKEQSPAYKSYIGLLEGNILDSRYCGYAINRLIHLNVLDVESQEVERLIQRAPRALEELLSMLLKPDRRFRAERDIRRLYLYCLKEWEDIDSENKIELEFERAVKACGGDSFEREAEGPVFYIGGDAIRVKIPEDEEFELKYWRLRTRLQEEPGRERLKALSAGEELQRW